VRKIYVDTRFKKDLKKAQKQGKDLEKLQTVLDILLNSQSLPSKYKDHQLRGSYQGCRELHIEPDWLLIYEITPEALYIGRLGSHSELFK
jgi:mRNA interferase YafQ